MNFKEFKEQLKPTQIEKTNIRVPKELHKKLKLIAINENVPIVSVTEYAIKEFIENYEKEQKQNK